MSEFIASPHEERFGFYTEGDCRKPFGCEKVLLIFVLIFGLIGQSAVFLYVYAYSSGFTSASIFMALIILVIFSFVSWFITAFLANMATSGEKFHYTADSKSMVITYKNKRFEYFYQDVESVTYKQSKHLFSIHALWR